MNYHRKHLKYNQVNIVSIGFGKMGGELAVSQRIVSLLKKKFSILTFSLIEDSKWKCEVLFKQVLFVFKSLAQIDSRFNIIYTSESLVVLCILIHKLFFFSNAKYRVIFHFHGTKATPYTAYYRNPFNIILKISDHYFVFLLETVFEKIAINFSNLVVVPDKRTARSLKKYNPIFLLPSFVDTSLFKPKTLRILREKIAVLKVGYIGRITREKGVFEFIEACGLYGNSIECSMTHIPGINDHLLDELKRYAVTNQIKLNIHFNLNANQVSKLLTNLDCVVLPSYSEHLPLSMLESLSSGVPVFVTNVGDCYDILARIDKKLQLHRGTAEEISTKMKWWRAQSYQYRKEISYKCRLVALDYSTSVFDKRVDDLFSRILSTPISSILDK